MKRSKKEDLIEAYTEEYLKGKSEERRLKFMGLPLDRKYGNIQAWRRREKAKAAQKETSVAEINEALRCTILQIKNLKDMSGKESKRLLETIDTLRETIVEFEKIRREHRLNELMKERTRLEKEIENLQNL